MLGGSEAPRTRTWSRRFWRPVPSELAILESVALLDVRPGLNGRAEVARAQLIPVGPASVSEPRRGCGSSSRLRESRFFRVDLVRDNHRGVLATRRSDGGIQQSPVIAAGRR